MKPITFSCHESLPFAPEEIAKQILDLTKWSDFHGYGPLPGIKVAEFEVRTEGIVGTRIRVTNVDGSSHVEEIVATRSTDSTGVQGVLAASVSFGDWVCGDLGVSASRR